MFSAGCGAFLRAGTVTTATLSDDAAQQATAPRESVSRRVSALVATLDLNRDGTLSAAEIANAPVLLRALDTDGDGVISPAELRRMAGAGSRTDRAVAMNASFDRTAPHLSGFTLAFALDANHDGEIQEMEVANAVMSLKALDANGDGQITPNEMPARATSNLARI